ncbi:HNH endonuclease [Bacillus phage vB_BanS_Skywalker]|uniref:HNH endonuclease n=2 Tax=Tsamsavirus TaxID=3044849 RepID=A0AAE8YYH5_9CAUD|nr:HNH endonuclease [Bacillus phage vB_BanS_Skywalker]YP_010681130.1 HNH endonuclease [Bacillus phage vB_BanS_MrDarsey]UGO48066.1 HNH endonuclease IV [Bacillus phage vB_BanS_MrDarsey]UGO51192.1 HNH endonuclease [Bacillus phage vB_BanS_Skywalker]
MIVWKSLKGIIDNGDNYEISNTGECRSISRTMIDKKGNIRHYKSKVLKLIVSTKGYMTINISMNSKQRKHNIHRLVALAFIPNPEGKDTVNHKNGDKTDNNVTNLEWSTNQENQIHAWETGLKESIKGECRYNSKLKEEDVIWIRSNYIPRHPEFNQKAIAKKFGISKETVSHIINKRKWKHI